MKHIPTFENFLSYQESIKENDPYFNDLGKSTQAKKQAQMKKQAAADDDDPEAYKPMPGDTKGKKNTKKSTHTTNYDKMYGDK